MGRSVIFVEGYLFYCIVILAKNNIESEMYRNQCLLIRADTVCIHSLGVAN